MSCPNCADYGLTCPNCDNAVIDARAAAHAASLQATIDLLREHDLPRVVGRAESTERVLAAEQRRHADVQREEERSWNAYCQAQRRAERNLSRLRRAAHAVKDRLCRENATLRARAALAELRLSRYEGGCS